MFQRSPSDAGERRLVVAIPAERDRVREPHPELRKLAAPWPPGPMLGTVGAVSESAAAKAGTLQSHPTSRVGRGRFSILSTAFGVVLGGGGDISVRREAYARPHAQQFADFYLAGYCERVKASTFATAETAINRWLEEFETRRVSTIDATEAERWARENRWAGPAVVTMLNDAERKGIIDRNPFKGLSKKGPGRRYMDPLTVEQVERLATVAEQQQVLGAFIRFTAYTGMRVGEVFGLE